MKSICHILTILALVISLAPSAHAEQESLWGCQIVTSQGEESVWMEQVEGFTCQEMVGMEVEGGTIEVAVQNLNPNHI